MTAREFEAMKAIARKRRAVHPAWIAARLGVSLEYARLLCAALIREDYIDITPAGLYLLTVRGKRELERRGVRLDAKWQMGDLDLWPSEVRKSLAHELAQELKKEMQGSGGELPRAKQRGGDEIKIKTDYSFPLEDVRLEHNLGTRAEREGVGKADAISEAAAALQKLGRRKREKH